MRAFAVSSWGRSHTCYEAPAAVAFRAGTWSLGALQATYCPNLDFDPPIRLEGIVGLRGFADSIVTIDYVSGRWLVEKAR